MKKLEIAPVRPSSRVEASACGRFATMPDKDDQRNAVADAAGGDLLAEPHQKTVPPIRVTVVTSET